MDLTQYLALVLDLLVLQWTLEATGMFVFVFFKIHASYAKLGCQWQVKPEAVINTIINII